MRTERQKRNLRRGGVPANAETAARATAARLAKARAEAGMTPEHRALKKLLQAALRKDAAKGSPSPETIQLSREVRMHDEMLRAAGRGSEQERQQQVFFDTLDQRLQNLLDAGLLQDPKPVVEPQDLRVEPGARPRRLAGG